MTKITDRELAVYQMHNNRYSKVEIADALKISDEAVEWCLEKNKKHPLRLENMDLHNQRGVI